MSRYKIDGTKFVPDDGTAATDKYPEWYDGDREPATVPTRIPDPESLRASVTVERMVQPVDYESAKVFLCVSGIRPETTPD